MNKVFKTAIWPLMALPLAYLAIIWSSLPATVPIHYNLTGKADTFGNKNMLLMMILILTAINAATYLLLTNLDRITPKKFTGENKPRMNNIAIGIAVFISAVLCFIIYNSSHADLKLDIKIIFAGVGLLLCVVGNYLHNIKPNYFAGIRLPWTLEDPENWRKTHLLAGKLFFAGGLLIALICLLLPTTISLISFFGIIIAMTTIPCVYSYRLYRHQKSIQR